MNRVYFEKFDIPGADMGELNCLPDIMNDNYIHAGMTKTERVTDEELPRLGKGMIKTLIPYQIQDGYNRSRSIKHFNSVVLENEFLKARFVPELGGRLWSLFDKKNNRELLYNNPVYQPGNLALRNAWFSGGVEWNVGIKGHNPLTCSPMFAQKLESDDGEEMVRMFEFERIREITYSITAKLSKDVLIVKNMIENTSDCDKNMYWWSNIAVDETPDTRVIAPAAEAYYCTYANGSYTLDLTDVPYRKNVDVSYPLNVHRARDFFYKIPDNEKKWITAVDKSGMGLVHMSDDILKGRKLFVWGNGTGGRHWNEWLSDGSKNYIEIQAGLMRTQLEHFIMDKNSVIEWTEGYSCLKGKPEILHGEDFAAAIDEVKKNISEKQKTMNNASFKIVKEYPCEYYGSGWGALENKIRKNPVSKILKFPEDSLDNEQEAWNNLLLNGEFAVPSEDAVITSYVKGDFWIEKAEKAKDSWMKYYHLGVMYYEKGDVQRSYECFEKSVELSKNPWAYRCLAQIERKERHNVKAAAEFIKKAIEMKKDYRPLLINFAEMMIENNEHEKWVECFEQLNDNLKNDGRLKMLYAMCLNEKGQINEVLKILEDNFIMNDIKEGEYSTSKIWIDVHKNILKSEGKDNLSDDEVLELYPLPYALDFRMH